MEGGARLIAGGERKGWVITPAILTGTKPGMKIRDEEAFGPVVIVEPYVRLRAGIGRRESLPVRATSRPADARCRTPSLPTASSRSAR